MPSLGELYDKIKKNANVQETMREALFSAYRSLDHEDDSLKEGFDNPAKLIQAKREELHEILQNLDSHLENKKPQEIAAFFSSLLDIYNQLYIHSTQGVISVKLRLIDYIPQSPNHIPPPIFYNEIAMVYTPEEIRAMQVCLETMDNKEPLYHFFLGVLDNAFDANHFNETSSYLLLEIANYFIMQLEKSGKSDPDTLEEFKERFQTNKRALDRTAREFRELEVLLNGHISKYPVLAAIPNLIRSLILIRFGIVPAKFAQEILASINENMKAYNQAKRIVAFDFNRLPSMQQALLRKQESILRFQMDILGYTGDVLKEGFSAFLGEYERMMVEIETKSARVDPDDKNAAQLLRQKKNLQNEYESRRRQIDVLESQQSLIEVQSRMVASAMKKFESDGSIHGTSHKSLKSAFLAEQAPAKKTAAQQDPDKPKRMTSMERRDE